ncbi:MAG: hypothetical protein WAS74_01660 [Candidatus Saccharimonas aalborgensis]
MVRSKKESGMIHGYVFVIIALALLTVFFGGFSVWAYLNYTDAKDDVDGKITVAKAEASKQQAEADEIKFLDREKQPMRQFVGPDDYGHLTFDYPKTWSAYQATDVSGGGGATYQAYLNPILVPPISVQNQKVALRVTIEQTSYEKSLGNYDTAIKKGDLKSIAWSNDNGMSGTRVDGNFNKDVRGAAIIVKMRDRTLTIRTDADIFKADFDALIKTVKFNQ